MGRLKYAAGVAAPGCYFSIEPFQSEYRASIITPIDKQTMYYPTKEEAKQWVDRQIDKYQKVATYLHLMDA